VTNAPGVLITAGQEKPIGGGLLLRWLIEWAADVSPENDGGRLCFFVCPFEWLPTVYVESLLPNANAMQTRRVARWKILSNPIKTPAGEGEIGTDRNWYVQYGVGTQSGRLCVQREFLVGT
jgi:hypothetical protein